MVNGGIMGLDARLNLTEISRERQRIGVVCVAPEPRMAGYEGHVTPIHTVATFTEVDGPYRDGCFTLDSGAHQTTLACGRLQPCGLRDAVIRASCTDKHGTSAYEQNTQQSPSSGFKLTPQTAQSITCSQ